MLLPTDPCCRPVIKEFAHAFSCAYIELWMHLGSFFFGFEMNLYKQKVSLNWLIGGLKTVCN